MRKPTFVNNGIYHVYNRGVEKRDVFLEKKDYLRFIHDMYEFNDTKPVLASNVRFATRRPSEVGAVEPTSVAREKELLVDILAFCLMPNHYHLLIRQRVDGGVVRFMQKLGTGYTMYFNQKNERVGPLFQGRFKAVAMATERQLLWIPFYIHLNPIDLVESEWKKYGIVNVNRAMEFLESYRWSSYLDYIGKKNFPSVIHRTFLLDTIGNPKEHRKEVQQHLKSGCLEVEPPNMD